MTVKRYTLFAGSQHYPRGGAEDFVLGTDSLEEAMSIGIEILGDRFKNFDAEWVNIFDATTLEVVYAAQVWWISRVDGESPYAFVESNEVELREMREEIEGRLK